MADPSRSPTTGGVPRWVKVFAIIALVVALLVVVLLLTGVGGNHGPGRHTGGASRHAGGATGGASGHTPPSGVHENTGAVGGPANADEADRTVKVTTLDTMTFAPSRINVSAGETVTFVVTNTGQAVHEFTLGDAAMQRQHADEMASNSHSPNSITLQHGETKQLTWRFGNTGTLEYGCHEPGHYQAGMRGQITIT